MCYTKVYYRTIQVSTFIHMNPLDILVSKEDIQAANEIFEIVSEQPWSAVASQPWRIRVTNTSGVYFIISRQQTHPTQLKGDTTSWEDALQSEVLDDELQCIGYTQDFKDLIDGSVQFLVATWTPPSFWLKSYATPEDLPQKYKV